jgi:DNA-binding response OmpR family regulator
MSETPTSRLETASKLYRMYDALKAADVEYCALSTTGINVFAADRKSIDAVANALDRAAQWDKLCTDLRHWQHECGKLHARIGGLLETLKAAQGGLLHALDRNDETGMTRCTICGEQWAHSIDLYRHTTDCPIDAIRAAIQKATEGVR